MDPDGYVRDHVFGESGERYVLLCAALFCFVLLLLMFVCRACMLAGRAKSDAFFTAQRSKRRREAVAAIVADDPLVVHNDRTPCIDHARDVAEQRAARAAFRNLLRE